ncbi:MAG: hypothetical protein WDO18_23270 [Acidobacteriota bacterium]
MVAANGLLISDRIAIFNGSEMRGVRGRADRLFIADDHASLSGCFGFGWICLMGLGIALGGQQ